MEFPTTPWTILAKATLHGDLAAASALERFYLLYHQPVEVAVTARGMNGEEARDITQAFFLHLMEHSTLRRAERDKGRFRSFLYGALRHFMADQYDRATAQKRGGGRRPVPLDGSGTGEVAGHAAETHVFDRAWALSLLQRALAKVEATLPPATFAAVKSFLPGSLTPPSGASAAAAAGLSETALRSLLSRVRKRLRAQLREEVSRTVSAPHEIEAEMAYLLEVLSRD